MTEMGIYATPDTVNSTAYSEKTAFASCQGNSYAEEGKNNNTIQEIQTPSLIMNVCFITTATLVH